MTRWTEEQVEQHNAKVRQGRGNHGASARAADEPSVVDEPEATHANQAFVSPVAIRLTHYRRTLADADAPIGKWFIDAIVEAGILHDDSPAFVTEVSHRQVQIEQWEEEQTVILLEPQE